MIVIIDMKVQIVELHLGIGVRGVRMHRVVLICNLDYIVCGFWVGFWYNAYKIK